MASAPRIDVPVVLRHAHDEVLLALAAETHEDEASHRALAAAYFQEAVQVISDHPRREYDWSALEPQS